MSTLFTLCRYWVSAEESRPGRKDYWNHTVLAQKTKANRFFWKISKVAFILALSANVAAGLTRVL